MGKPKNRIKELRLKNNLSQKQLADEIGISNQSISFYENGNRKPKIEVWQKLANFFNVPVTYIQGLSNISDPNIFK
ncbi:helix-turn-helix domain-containing protein, partial [Lactobacillus crispatus]|uniref:helix-turn-helix domain-containing protein n=1 Tax=Lactobacillus crispatus TaxID=47770 RepID=UPI00123B6AAC